MQSSEWEKEKSELCLELKAKLVHSKDEITFAEITREKLPSFLKSYLKSQVKKYFEAEKIIVLKNSKRYNLETPEIRQIKSELAKTVQQTTIFSKKEITDAIDKTISLQMDFLIIPRSTLLRIFFKTKAVRVHAEIEHAINGISDNRPYMRHLIQIIKNVNQEEISKELFIQLTQEAEEEVYRQKPISAFMQDISAILNFYSLIYSKPTNAIKQSLLVDMLRQRNLQQLAQQFKDYQPQNENHFIDKNEVEKLLEKFYFNVAVEQPVKRIKTVEKKAIVPTVEKKAIPLKKIIESLPKNETNTVPESIKKEAIIQTEAQEETIPESFSNERKKNWVLFGSGSAQAIGRDEIEQLALSEPQAPIPKKPKIIYKDDQKPLTKKKSTLSSIWDDRESKTIDRKQLESQPDGPIPDLDLVIDVKSRKMLVKKIFKKDEAAYKFFIAKLQEKMTWKEAKVLIDHELFNRNVEPFSREAIRLGDLVFNRYFPKKL